jgi:hypothetical protein
MSFKRLSTLTAALAACAVVGSGPAHATIANTVESISLSGAFPSPGQAPFGSGAFTLNFSAPLTSFGAGFGLSDVYGITSPNNASGTYDVGGTSQAFSDPTIVVQGSATTAFEIGGVIGNYPISATFAGTTNTPFFTATSSNGGTTYTLLPGTYALTDTGAYVNNDPPFSNGVLTIGSPANTVPEPSTLALFAVPLLALAFLRRRKAHGSL